LAEVGYVDALLARDTPDGLMIIDGHLRAETTPDMEVPVLILDVTEEEADKILATFDPPPASANGLPASPSVTVVATNMLIDPLAPAKFLGEFVPVVRLVNNEVTPSSGN
jgi:hypothetical protein